MPEYAEKVLVMYILLHEREGGMGGGRERLPHFLRMLNIYFSAERVLVVKSCGVAD